jgi:hypothetical protein
MKAWASLTSSVLFGLLLVPLQSSAAVIYEWEGKCTERYFGGGQRRVELECPEVFRAIIRMPDDYERGSEFAYFSIISEESKMYGVRFENDPYIGGFTFFDNQFFGALPASNGQGELNVNCGGGCGRFHVNSGFYPQYGWLLNAEVEYQDSSGLHVGYFMRGSTSSFRLIPEPSSISLLVVPMMFLMSVSRKYLKSA